MFFKKRLLYIRLCFKYFCPKSISFKNFFLFKFIALLFFKISYFFNNWIFSTNHKKIAILYFYFVAISGFVGLILATIIRIELSYPGQSIFFNNGEKYLTTISIHGIVMVFFFIMPLIFGAFGNLLLPLQLGIRDVAFPRLNSFMFWITPAGFILLLHILLFDKTYKIIYWLDYSEIRSMLQRRFFVTLNEQSEIKEFSYILLNNERFNSLEFNSSLFSINKTFFSNFDIIYFYINLKKKLFSLFFNFNYSTFFFVDKINFFWISFLNFINLKFFNFDLLAYYLNFFLNFFFNKKNFFDSDLTVIISLLYFDLSMIFFNFCFWLETQILVFYIFFFNHFNFDLTSIAKLHDILFIFFIESFSFLKFQLIFNHCVALFYFCISDFNFNLFLLKLSLIYYSISNVFFTNLINIIEIFFYSFLIFFHKNFYITKDLIYVFFYYTELLVINFITLKDLLIIWLINCIMFYFSITLTLLNFWEHNWGNLIKIDLVCTTFLEIDIFKLLLNIHTKILFIENALSWHNFLIFFNMYTNFSSLYSFFYSSLFFIVCYCNILFNFFSVLVINFKKIFLSFLDKFCSISLIDYEFFNNSNFYINVYSHFKLKFDFFINFFLFQTIKISEVRGLLNFNYSWINTLFCFSLFNSLENTKSIKLILFFKYYISRNQYNLLVDWQSLKFERELWRNCDDLVFGNNYWAASTKFYSNFFEPSSLLNKLSIWAPVNLIPGWAFITPYTSKIQFSNIGKVDIALISIFFATLNSIFSALNFLVTNRYLSSPFFKNRRDLRPLFVDAMLVASRMILAANPPLLLGIILLFCDRHFNSSIFDCSNGGDTVLFQHLFWFFGHPEVYIIIIPCFGFMNSLLPNLLKKRLSGKLTLQFSMYTIGIMGFAVWGHHMYMVGLAHGARTFYSTITVMISVPASTKILHWCVTLINSSFNFEIPFLFLIAFMYFFILGGLSGMFLAHIGFDVLFHDTFFVIGHFHVMLSAAAMSCLFAAFYFYFESIFGFSYSKIFGYLHFFFYVIGQLVTLIPMFWLGYAGMPRRIMDYPVSFGPWHSIISSGHFLTLLSIFFFFIMLLTSFYKSKSFKKKDYGLSRLNKKILYMNYEYQKTKINFIFKNKI